MDVRDVANVEVIHAADQIDLLFEGKLFEQRVDPGFDVGLRRLRRLAQDRQAPTAEEPQPSDWRIISPSGTIDLPIM